MSYQPIYRPMVRHTSSMRKFASDVLGLAEEEERVFVMASPRRLADVTVLKEVSVVDVLN